MIAVVFPRVFVLLALLAGLTPLLIVALLFRRRSSKAIDMQKIVGQRDAARTEFDEDDEDGDHPVGRPNHPR